MINVLQGLRVVELAHLAAAPVAGRILADLGATVIKIESPTGDVARTVAPLGSDVSALFEHCNRNKQGVSIDMATGEGVELVRDLIRTADIFITNYRPHFLNRVGLNWEGVRALKPDVIAAYVTGHGMTDPRSDMASGDVVAQAESGITSYLGEEDGSPLCNPGAPADVAAAVQVALGVTAALVGRLMGRQGGMMLDISILDAHIATDLIMLPVVAATNGAFKARRTGALHPSVFPHGVFKAGTEFVTLSAYGAGPDGHWPRLARAMGYEDLATDPKLATEEQRSSRREELTPIIEAWLGSFASAQQAVGALREAGIVAARVTEPEEVIADPRARSRGMVQSLAHPLVGTFSVLGLPIMFNGRFAEAGAAPTKGQHTRIVLQNVLGLSREKIDDLVERRVAIAA